MLADVQRPTTVLCDTGAPPRRSDEHIARAALRALAREHIVPANRFTIDVEHGWLTLEGRAAHLVERSAAECVVRYVPGVAGVTNRLVIGQVDR